MDKCILSSENVNDLFAWRDRNKDLVRRFCCPVKGIEVILKDTNGVIKYIREESTVRVYGMYNNDNNTKFRYVLTVNGNGTFKVEKTTGQKLFLEQDSIMSVCGLYFALMALMAFGDDVEYSQDELEIIENIVKEKSQEKTTVKVNRKKRDNITYLFNHEPTGRVILRAKGRHNSPRGEFNVRGHFRRYKNGRKVWIEEYKKGTGKRKNKTYKL